MELEAAVQRDMNDASAWLALGVKQQENEREHKALQALQRATELDPSNLSAWLALAVSFTNDGNRLGTYHAIHEWVSRNDSYKASVLQFRGQNPDTPNASITERYTYLTQCLIAMARSGTGGDIDADIQIALAILLNTNEVWIFTFRHPALTAFYRTIQKLRIVSLQRWLCDRR
jgi:peroxin-5